MSRQSFIEHTTDNIRRQLKLCLSEVPTLFEAQEILNNYFDHIRDGMEDVDPKGNNRKD